MMDRILQSGCVALALCAVVIGACNKDSDSPSAQSAVQPTQETPLDRLYISLPAADAIALIDPANGSLVQQIPIGMLPHDFLLSRDGRKLYVMLVGSQSVAEVDVATGRVLRTMLTAPVPQQRADGSVIQQHIDRNAFDHTTCFDCHRGGSDGVKPAVVGTRPLGIAWNAAGDALLVTNARAGTLAEIAIDDGKIRSTIALPPTGDAHEPAALAATAHSIVVALRPSQPSYSASVIRVLNATDFSQRYEISVGSDANHVVADSDSEIAYISNFESNTVTRVYLNTGKHDTLTVNDGPLGTLVVNKSRLLTANYYKNTMTMTELENGVGATIPLAVDAQQFSNPTHIALSTDPTRAYVVSSGTNGHVLELNLETMRFQRVFNVGGLPFNVINVAMPKPYGT